MFQQSRDIRNLSISGDAPTVQVVKISLRNREAVIDVGKG